MNSRWGGRGKSSSWGTSAPETAEGGVIISSSSLSFIHSCVCQVRRKEERETRNTSVCACVCARAHGPVCVWIYVLLYTAALSITRTVLGRSSFSLTWVYLRREKRDKLASRARARDAADTQTDRKGEREKKHTEEKRKWLRSWLGSSHRTAVGGGGDRMDCT